MKLYMKKTDAWLQRLSNLPKIIENEEKIDRLFFQSFDPEFLKQEFCKNIKEETGILQKYKDASKNATVEIAHLKNLVLRAQTCQKALDGNKKELVDDKAR